MKRIAPILGLVLAMTGCFGDTTEPMPEPEPQPQPDGVALDQRFDNNREDTVQTFSIDASSGGTVVGSAGTSVTFGPSALTLDGQPVEGTVDVALVEVYDRAHPRAGAGRAAARPRRRGGEA